MKKVVFSFNAPDSFKKGDCVHCPIAMSCTSRDRTKCKAVIKKPAKSIAKGKSGERELAQLLRNRGYIKARRGAQFCGSNGDADVVGVDGLHIECKRQEKVLDEAFLLQSEADARKGELPVVMYRRNHEEWKALLRLDLFMEMWDELSDKQKDNIREKIKMRRVNV